MRTKGLTVEDVEFIAHSYSKVYLEWDEPVPDFKTRYPGVLERCLIAPHQAFEGRLYEGLIKKAAILFYLMVKNHPFHDGNKRMAVITLLVFLVRNGKWLAVSNEDLYMFAKSVAGSDVKSKNSTLKEVERFLRKHVS